MSWAGLREMPASGVGVLIGLPQGFSFVASEADKRRSALSNELDETIDFQEKKIVRSIDRPGPLEPPCHEVIQRRTLFLQTFACLGKHVDQFSSPVQDFMREIDMNVAFETRRIVRDGFPLRSVRRFLTRSDSRIPDIVGFESALIPLGPMRLPLPSRWLNSGSRCRHLVFQQALDHRSDTLAGLCKFLSDEAERLRIDFERDAAKMPETRVLQDLVEDCPRFGRNGCRMRIDPFGRAVLHSRARSCFVRRQPGDMDLNHTLHRKFIKKSLNELCE